MSIHQTDIYDRLHIRMDPAAVKTRQRCVLRHSATDAVQGQQKQRVNQNSNLSHSAKTQDVPPPTIPWVFHNLFTFNKHPVKCSDVEEHGEKVEDAGNNSEHIRLYLWGEFWNGQKINVKHNHKAENSARGKAR